MLQAKFCDGRLEVQMKLAAVVRLDVDEIAGHDAVQSFEKISSGCRCMRRVHASERKSGVTIDCRKDVPLLPAEVPHNRVDTE